MKTIAFIPLRGGSKSIPLKNIKKFCGKPLVYWVINALEQVKEVDEIIVATDSSEIERTALSFGLDKIKIFRRSAENAQDTSPTESVVLEFLNSSGLAPEDTFILAQATSPLTEKKHFEEGLAIFRQGKYDSLLTCVRNYRFFWNPDGAPQNYDYRRRPRRQDFKGTLMENGAFYINTVGNILKYENRLSGKIGIYEMPEYTALEIDEPDDWTIIENLMRRKIPVPKTGKKIKLFLSDVDGVMTDAGMYYSESGDEMKKFNTHDGMGFKILQQVGIKTGIITTENTKMVENRVKKLNIDYLYQGKQGGNKLEAALDICKKENITLSETAYIGDDINCKELLSAVGYAFCPADAVPQIKAICGIHILKAKGGEGAVREAIDLLSDNESSL